MTDGQIDKAIDQFRASLRKHSSEFDSEATQLALGNKELAPELLGVFRKYVEANSGMIIRHFKVDRTKTPKQMIDATGRKQYVDDGVLATMPTDGPEEGDLYFFPGKRFTPAAELAARYESLELVPDPYAQSQVNTDDSSFADEHPNGVQWQDDQGDFCFAAFRRWFVVERFVDVDRNARDWADRWWFAGRRKN
jgi:hypothetical protein